MPDPTMPASAPMSAIEMAWKPRREPSRAAAARMRALRSGSRIRRCAIWSACHPAARVASESGFTFVEVTVDFAEPDEHRDLRAAVGAIAADFGPAYFTAHAADRTPCTELWDAVAKAGFVGVNVPAEYGGGGGGLT